jgi:hypothetical protein
VFVVVLRSPALALLLLVGCPTLPTTQADSGDGPVTTERTFLADYIDAYCNYWRTCEEALFAQQWEDVEACAMDRRRDFEKGNSIESCDYDQAEAVACIAGMREMLDCTLTTETANEVSDHCMAVYTGCDTG